MPAQDLYSSHSASATGPARRLRNVTPSDTDELEFVCSGIVCSAGGALSIVGIDDSLPVTLPVVAGQIYPVRAKAVRATGTTATGIVALIS